MQSSDGLASIRVATEADAEAIHAIYEPIVTSTFISFETEPPGVAEMKTRMADSHLWLVSERDGVVVGYAYATRFHPRPAYRWSVEVSVYVDERSRASGIGRPLVTELLVQLEDRGFVNAFAGIALPNPGSVKLFESLGFERIALQRNVGFKLDKWHDVAWWQKSLREPTIPPPELAL